MGSETKISWAQKTWNPWVGCTKVGPLCDHCYAEEWDNRYGGGTHWGPGAPRRRTKTWGDPIKWHKEAAGLGISYRVFMASLADFFDNEVDPAWRAEVWEIVKRCTSLDWLILTKRIGNLQKMLPKDFLPSDFGHVTIIASIGTQEELGRDFLKLWAAKHQEYFPRIGISAEPLLEPLRFSHGQLYDLDWLIVGGESGAVRRPFEMEWAENLAAECEGHGVPFFFKQDTAFRSGERGRASEALWNTKQFPRFR